MALVTPRAPATLTLAESFAAFPVLRLRLRIVPVTALKLPAENKGNAIRGAFGTTFRRLACVPQCANAQQCPLDEARVNSAPVCPYRAVFEPAPPAEVGRLRSNQDAPRPFIFEPPGDVQTTYQPGESFEFGLTLLGSGVGYLAYFLLAFREVAEAGFGLNRARCMLQRAVTSPWDQSKPECVYSSDDQIMHSPKPMRLGDYVDYRLGGFGDAAALASRGSLRLDFLTPTCLKHEGGIVRQPEFHQIFKRARDRVNALSTFYGAGPIAADYGALGHDAEAVAINWSRLEWNDRYRVSSKTHRRHEISGFTGTCAVATAPGQLDAFLPWLVAAELLHVGRHAPWGCGMLEIEKIAKIVVSW